MTHVVSANAIAEVGALIGDPARAGMLSALMDGRALTAGELAHRARITPQTASGHLAKLAASHVLAMEKQGRHRYFRLASPDIAHLLEAMMAVAAQEPVRQRATGPRDEKMRAARTCYDHIAGRLGTGLADALIQRGHVLVEDGSGLVTDGGEKFLCDFGADLQGGKRPLCRTCLDWSERRPHLAGRLGAALLDRSLQRDWVRRLSDSRALMVTPLGRAGFAEWFGVVVD